MAFREKPETLFLSFPKNCLRTEAFDWIIKHSEIRGMIAPVRFSYVNGVDVEFFVPLSWTDEYLMDTMCSIKSLYNEKFVSQISVKE